MDRQTFLAQADVQGFIKYLTESGKNLPVQFNILGSQFADENQNTVLGFDQVLAQYQWRSYWSDWRSHNQNVRSASFDETYQSLSQLRERLQTAIREGHTQEAYQTCRAILQWGGVDNTGTIEVLDQLRQENTFIDHLQQLTAVVDADRYDRQQLTAFQMNSGWTKIAALASQTHVPIYDSRVGAAISWLYHRYRQQHPQHTRGLSFLAGTARGRQIRNPAQLPAACQPQRLLSYGAKGAVEWIVAIIELNWLMEDLLVNVGWFPQYPDLKQKKHAFEAMLFMIGYDLCSVEPTDHIVRPDNNMPNPPVHPQPYPQQHVTWVPTGCNVELALQRYLNGTTLAHDHFVLNELGVLQLPQATIKKIAQGGQAGFQALLNNTVWTIPHINRNQRQQVCLVDAWIVGVLHQYKRRRQIEILINCGFAGTENAAGTLLTTGRNFGKFFGLLNQHDQHTPLFRQYAAHFEQITTHLNNQ
jgi:hypothetical protein